MGLRIKEVIIEHDLTFKEVADRMGISSSALLQAVNGRKSKDKYVEPNPTYKLLQSIADAIPCHITELFDQPQYASNEEEMRFKVKDLQERLYWIQEGINGINHTFGFDNAFPKK